MSKIVLVAFRTPPDDSALRQRLGRFLASLCPDNRPMPPIQVHGDGRGLYLGVFDPLAPETVHDCSAYAGWLADPSVEWWRTGTPSPEGTYALLRSSADVIEARVDYAATRALWIAKTDQIFIATTSQRAIPAFLGSFELNPRAVLWMLSSGSLGPEESWDLRARPLAPGGVARLDRASWRLDIDEPAIEFNPEPLPEKQHRALMRQALAETCGDLRLEWSNWIFPLSGGVDCRAILLNVRDKSAIRCVTWGLKRALDAPGSDAQVAGQLADYLGLPRQYFPTDPADEPIERIFQRFLIAGEGRVDHIAGYMDGLKLWSDLVACGTRGIVRGDEPYAMNRVASADEVPAAVALMRWSDHRGLPTLESLDLTHLGQQPIPPKLEHRPDEAPADWRDRLLHSFKIPTVTAALNDIKSAYVEIANPLLTRRIVELARQQPATLRTGKKLLIALNREWKTPVPYATSRAIAWAQDALAAPAVRELLNDELASQRTVSILSRSFSNHVAQALNKPATAVPASKSGEEITQKLKFLIPERFKAARRRRLVRPPPSAAQLGFRAWLIAHMSEILSRDAQNR